MKKVFALLLATAFVMPVFAAEGKAAPEVKTVCVDVQGKDGKAVIDPKTKKPKQNCTKVKVRKKHEGTKIEDAKKK
jgi:azurin